MQGITPLSFITRSEVYSHAPSYRTGIIDRHRLQRRHSGKCLRPLPEIRGLSGLPSEFVEPLAQIKNFYAQRHRGAYTDADWAKLEQELIAAGREGRIAGATPLAKNWSDGF
jgi:hypothetical protein